MSREERHSKLTRVSISLLGIVEVTLLKKTLGREGPPSPRIRIFFLLLISMFVFFVTLLPLIMDNTRWVLSVHPDLFSSPPLFFPRGSSRAFWVCRGWLFPPPSVVVLDVSPAFHHAPPISFFCTSVSLSRSPFALHFPIPPSCTSPCITSCTPATPYLRHHSPDDLPPSPSPLYPFFPLPSLRLIYTHRFHLDPAPLRI